MVPIFHVLTILLGISCCIQFKNRGRAREDCKQMPYNFYNENKFAGGNSSSSACKDTTNTSEPISFLLVGSKLCMNNMIVMLGIKTCPRCDGGLVNFEH